MLNEDYREMLQCLAEEGVKFLLVGAYALAAHGYPRATMDIDIWVMPSPDNAAAVLRGLFSKGGEFVRTPKFGIATVGVDPLYAANALTGSELWAIWSLDKRDLLGSLVAGLAAVGRSHLHTRQRLPPAYRESLTCNSR
jgi:hypothetical protein